METLKQEQSRLQHVLLNQKFTPADIDRINREKRELQQTISSLSKSLGEAEQHMWNEEIALAKVKEKVGGTNLVQSRTFRMLPPFEYTPGLSVHLAFQDITDKNCLKKTVTYNLSLSLSLSPSG